MVRAPDARANRLVPFAIVRLPSANVLCTLWAPSHVDVPVPVPVAVNVPPGAVNVNVAVTA
jgi:hypothetical protein